jgi:hypothetical protein
VIYVVSNGPEDDPLKIVDGVFDDIEEATDEVTYICNLLGDDWSITRQRTEPGPATLWTEAESGGWVLPEGFHL